MIVDYRIYATIYAVCVVIYLGACALGLATIDRDPLQKVFKATLFGASSVMVLTAFTQYLDWLWS